MKYTLITGCAIALGIAMLYGASVRDARLEAWAKEYEACVKQEYHTTPTRWYSEHGYYPECDTSI